MHKISELVDKGVSFLSFLLMTSMSVVIAIQVFFRKVLGSSLSWSEELARYLFVWIIMIVAGSGIKHGFHVTITFVKDRLPESIQTLFSLIGSFLLLVFASVLIWHGLRLAMITRIQLSPAMRISMFWVYLSIPVSGALIFIHELDRLSQIFAATTSLKDTRS